MAQKWVIWNKLGYKPYPLQMPLHESEARVLQLVGAEGSGKSLMTTREIMARLPWCNLVYLVGQEFENTRKEFEYMRDDCLALGLTDGSMISEPKNPPWGIATSTGCRIVTVSVTKSGATSIIAKGEQPDIIALLEAGVMVSHGVFHASWRRISRSNGMLLLSGTLKDDFGWYATLEDDLKDLGNDYSGETFSLPAWANLSVYPGGEHDAAIQVLRRTLPEDEYSRTVAARKMTSLAAIFGGVFNPDTHMRECPFTEHLPVELWIDPGWFPSAYGIAVMQIHGNEVWQIDEVYENFKTHEEVIEICKSRPWWAAVRELVGDIAMQQHQADRSAQEVWQAKTGLAVRGKRLRVQDGIARHRAMLVQRRLFHDSKCENTKWEYKMYRRRVDKDGNAISDEPINENNHLLRAIAYGLTAKFGLSDYLPPSAGGRYKAADPWERVLDRQEKR